AVCPAEAQENEEAVRFDYRAPPECPDAVAFTSRVQARTARARLAAEGELARTFTVEVTRNDVGSAARLTFTDSRGAPVVRAVQGETCDEVVSAIALVTALAVEAGPTQESEPAPSSSAVTPPAPPPEAPVAPAPQRHAPLPSPKPDVVAWSVGLQGGVSTWMGPAPNLGLGAFVDAGPYRGPSGRLTLLRSTSRALVPVKGEASTFRRANFTALVARLEACPIVVGLGSGFRLLPCVDLGLGALEGGGEKSEALSPVSSTTIFWADVVPTLRVDWTLSDSLVFFGQAEVGLPLVSHTFLFKNPDDTVFEVPRVGVGATLGVAWRFP
ncbi:MAG TPA: hypothetical protein VF103_14040, partial [Polyangiaceae bacterium]